MENLSSGFLDRFFSGENLCSVTPILRVQTPFLNGKITLDDGQTVQSCFIMNRMEEVAMELIPGQRVLIKKFHLSTQRTKGRPKHIMIEDLQIFAEQNAPLESILPADKENIGVSIGVGTSSKDPLLDLEDLPSILPPLLVTTNLCTQSKFIVGQMGRYFRAKYPNIPNVKISRAVSRLTGLNEFTLRTYYGKSHQETNPSNVLPPKCRMWKKPLTKKECWAKVAAHVDGFIKLKIRNTIHSHYRSGKKIKVETLLDEVRRDLASGPDSIAFDMSKRNFTRLPQGMGFRYERIKNRHQIYERHDLGELRRKYLRKIRQYRSNGAKIFYMDETWVYEGMSHTYDWVDQAIKKNPLQSYRQNFTTGPREPPTRGKRAIVIGAITDNRAVLETFKIFEGGLCSDGDYHKTMNGERFGEWLRQSIPHFKSYSAGDHQIVLVLDNAPYHAIVTNKSPRKNDKKQVMIDFIQKNGGNVPNGATKSVLFVIIQKIVETNPGKFDQKVAEKVCAENGIELLWLPPYHCEFNSIELLWANMKHSVRDKGTTKSRISEIRELALNAVKNISEEVIRNLDRHVREKEEWFWKEEGIRMPVQPLIIEMDEDDSGLFDSESDEDEDEFLDLEQFVTYDPENEL